MSYDLLDRLNELRTDLVDLAFTLERRGQMEAADLAIATSMRLQEFFDETMDRLSASATGRDVQGVTQPRTS